MKERESFSTRIGFILVSAGCAIGIGNVWKFPWLAGQNGGGIFVLFYLLFLVAMAIPVLTMELAVGRAGRSSALQAYKKLEKPGTMWHLHGYVCFAGNAILMMYYTSVSGWMLDYFIKFAMGTFEGVEGDAIGSVFESMVAAPVEMLIVMGATVILGFLIVAFGVQKGVEQITKIMMVCLLLLITVLAVHSLTLPGAMEGVSFYLLPDPSRVSNLREVITAAMNQAFFTMSLGIGSMEIFGSYMSKKYSLTGEAVRIGVLDTFVALMAGLIIFPACFSFGVEPDAGPSLIFYTLPRVFSSMAGGRLWGTLFFLFMTFASFSTVIAVFESLMAFCVDNLGWRRKKTAIVGCLLILITSVPCALSNSILSGVTIFGMGILDFEDYIVSNLLLPLGSLYFLLFCVTKLGWGFENYLAECNSGEGMKMPKGMAPYLTFVVPILLFVIFLQGIL